MKYNRTQTITGHPGYSKMVMTCIDCEYTTDWFMDETAAKWFGIDVDNPPEFVYIVDRGKHGIQNSIWG